MYMCISLNHLGKHDENMRLPKEHTNPKKPTSKCFDGSPPKGKDFASMYNSKDNIMPLNCEPNCE
jgi:hypothetical protein